MLNFYNISIKIAGQSLLAKSATINEENSVSPIYSLGYNGSFQASPNGPVRNSVSIDYIIEPGNDTSYPLINKIRNYDFLFNNDEIIKFEKDEDIDYLYNKLLNTIKTEKK